jgi:hypothetical protein
MPFHEYHDLLEAFIDPELACAEGRRYTCARAWGCWYGPHAIVGRGTAPPALARVANTQLDEVAGTLVNIFAINARVGQFVRTLTTLEILQTSTWRAGMFLRAGADAGAPGAQVGRASCFAATRSGPR